MCATFRVDESIIEKYRTELAEDFLLREGGEIFPTEKAIAVTAEKVKLFKFGFTRFDGKGVIYNARAETVGQKQTFAPHFFSRRCVIPVIGFYEWTKDKRKMYFSRSDGGQMFLCAFYRDEPDGGRFVVLTKAATAPVDEYHDRIPVIAGERDAKQFIENKSFAPRFAAQSTDIVLDAYRA